MLFTVNKAIAKIKIMSYNIYVVRNGVKVNDFSLKFIKRKRDLFFAANGEK